MLGRELSVFSSILFASGANECNRNGDPAFTVGPPENDAVFKIQKIVMMYNTTSTASGQQNGTVSGAPMLERPAKMAWLVVAGSSLIMAYLLS